MSRHKHVRLGAVAYDPKVIPIWDIIHDYYQKNDFPIDYVLFSNYEAQVEALLEGFIDIAWNTNVAYIKVQQALDSKAKVLAMRDTDVDFTTRFIARVGNGVKSPKDLKGKRFALGSADSAQAAILPVHFLKTNGIDPQKDVDLVRFNLDVGKHGDTGTSEYEVLRAIQSGEADAGAIGENTWIRMLEQGLVENNEIQAIWTSPGYSHCNFTTLPEFENELAQQFTSLLFAMDPTNSEIKKMMEMEGLNEWIRPEGKGLEGYKVLDAAMKEQGIRW